MGLPKFAAFKNESCDYYLQYIHEGPLKGNLQYSSDNVVSLLSKFELEPSKKMGDYVNIRCCYNNKYLASSNGGDYLITPFVSKPAENESSWPCTLFKLTTSNREGTYNIYDVWRRCNAYRFKLNRTYENCLTTVRGDEGKYSDIAPLLIDYETIVVFPKYVAFKSDIEKYARPSLYDGVEYLEFSSDDIGLSKVRHQVFSMGDGSIRIKCEDSNKYWVRQPNDWILLKSINTDARNKDNLFWPIRISQKKVALRSLGNNKYCKRLTAEGKVSCLSAQRDSITKEAEFEIVEPLLSTEIYNCRYRTMDGRVYEEKVLTMTTGEATNGGTKETSMAVSLKYVLETSKCWESSMSSGWGVTTNIKVGFPEVCESGIEINYNETKSHTWGETTTEMEEIMTTYTVNVPPMTRMKVTLLATKAKCDVPFSYTRRDVFRNGRHVITDCDDGLYVGVNSYKFDYQNKPMPF